MPRAIPTAPPTTKNRAIRLLAVLLEGTRAAAGSLAAALLESEGADSGSLAPSCNPPTVKLNPSIPSPLSTVLTAAPLKTLTAAACELPAPSVNVGFKAVIWGSILGVLPFTLALPYVSLFWTGALSVLIGLILASAFSAILVYAQELVPGRVGMISGLFFGFAFGMAGIAAAVLGRLADRAGIDFVYQVCAFLPVIGLLTGFLPNLGRKASERLSPSGR